MSLRTQNTSHFRRVLPALAVITVLIACIGFLVPFWSNRDRGVNPNGQYTDLRGGTLVVIISPRQESNGQEETFTVSTDHMISSVRSSSSTQLPNYSAALLPDSLWRDLEAMRQEWCIQVPVTKPPDQQGSGYTVALACHPTRNPVLYFQTEQLDRRLLAAIQVAR